MSNPDEPMNETEQDEPKPRRLRLPPIVKPEDEGIGDVISRLSRSVGLAPCQSCLERQQRLNAWMPFHKK